MRSKHTTLPALTGMMLLSFWLRLKKKFQRKEALFFLEIMCAVGQCRATLTCKAADVHSIVETPFLCSARSKFLARQTSSHPSHPLGRVSIDRQLFNVPPAFGVKLQALFVRARLLSRAPIRS
jgi:hypothetical protein